MNVALVNGSPHKHGCTDRALQEIQRTLAEEGVDSQIFWIGAKPVGGCMACGGCARSQGCVINDKVNEFLPIAREADAFVFGGPVHFGHAAASLLGFMDRVFYSGSRLEGPSIFAHKPAAAVASARRSGTTCSFDDITKFFTISQMPVVSSRYWNNVHGNTAEEVEQDEEGLAVMRQLAHNMAWELRCIEAARAAGVPGPIEEPRPRTNFIR